MHPQHRPFTVQLFLDFNAIFSPRWPLIFLVSTIHQVIWPSPGTLVTSPDPEPSITVQIACYTHGNVITQNRRWKYLLRPTAWNFAITHHHQLLFLWAAFLLCASHTCISTFTSCWKSMTLPTTFDQLLANLNSGPANQNIWKSIDRWPSGRFKRPHSGCQKGGSAHNGRHSRNLGNRNEKAQSVFVWNKSILIRQHLLFTRLHAW